jgi:hypothetical protein
MPGANSSASRGRLATPARRERHLLFRHVGEQTHEPRPQNGQANRALVLGAVPRPATRLDMPLPVNHQSQGLQVLEVDVDRAGRMIAPVRAESAAKFLLEPCTLLATLLDLDSVQCRHIRSILSPRIGHLLTKSKLLLSAAELATLEIRRTPYHNDREDLTAWQDPRKATPGLAN